MLLFTEIEKNFLSKGRYEWIIGRLNELSSDNTIKKTSQDYRIMAPYDISERNNNNTVKKSLKHHGTNRLYVTVDEIFDVMHTEHLSTGHGARDISNYKIKESYANVTKDKASSSYRGFELPGLYCMLICAKHVL